MKEQQGNRGSEGKGAETKAAFKRLVSAASGR